MKIVLSLQTQFYTKEIKYAEKSLLKKLQQTKYNIKPMMMQHLRLLSLPVIRRIHLIKPCSPNMWKEFQMPI